MKNKTRTLLRSLVFFLGALWLLFALARVVPVGPASAQSDTAVRSELLRLRDRIDRLESEARGVSRHSAGTTTIPRRGTPSGTGVVNGQTVGRSDPLFERLSTLVIELREQVNKLDQRVSALEGETNGRN